MRTVSIVLLLAAAPLVRTADAQDALEAAKAHYAAADYEEALTTLTRVDAAPAASKVEMEQYKAFCFIALGKLPEAERAVASLVALDPKYVPSPTVASPRVLTLVSEMRRKELPGIARRLFDEGRTAFKEKQFDRAQSSFDLLIEILDDPAMKGRPESDDLRVLAEGFMALSDAAATPPPKVEEPAPVATPARLNTVILPPVALQQTLPEWVPPDPISASREYAGSLKVVIGADGRVKSSSIEKPSYPTYDARLLLASRQWVYQPATRNGEPIESEKLIAILLRKRD